MVVIGLSVVVVGLSLVVVGLSVVVIGFIKVVVDVPLGSRGVVVFIFSVKKL